eukprot:768681-Hanusia_phi.AAC.16
MCRKKHAKGCRRYAAEGAVARWSHPHRTYRLEVTHAGRGEGAHTPDEERLESNDMNQSVESIEH